MKRGEYTVRIEARRAELFARDQESDVRPTADYSALFTADDQAIEDRIEQEILHRFGGYDAMIQTFEAELVGLRSMTAAEAVVYLRACAEKEE